MTENQETTGLRSRAMGPQVTGKTSPVFCLHDIGSKRRARGQGWMKCGTISLALLSSIQHLHAQAPPDPKNVTVLSQMGAVAADHPLASATGAAILDQGGSAADAAVATLLVLGVVNPFASGLGGGGFCVAWSPQKPEIADALDFRETAPAKASRDMYLRQGKADEALSRLGGLAVAIPGEAAGLEALHRRHGKLPWASLVQPAYEYAAHGFFVGKLLPARVIASSGRMPAKGPLRQAFTPQGSPNFVTPYSWHTRKDLAQTLALLRDKGAAKGFYQGPLAQAIVAQVQAEGGMLSLEDMRTYAPIWRTALKSTYRDTYTFYTMPPPSSGGIVLAQVLNILEAFDLRALGWGPKAVHLILEALKHAFADRARYHGDADFVNVPVATLTSKAHAKTLRQKINPEATLPKEAYGSTLGPKDDHGTSHISVVDATGHMVACTSTVNTTFGSMVYVPDWGLVMNNEMDDFSAQPGVPNAYGLVGNAQNAIAPGKRPLSSMSPTIVLQGTTPKLVVGASGGPTIITGTIFAILRLLDFDQSPTEAVTSTRLHHQWMPHKLFFEGLPLDPLATGLAARGHEVEYRPAFNSVQLLYRSSPTQWTAVSDPRKEGRPAAQTQDPVKD